MQILLLDKVEQGKLVVVRKDTQMK